MELAGAAPHLRGQGGRPRSASGPCQSRKPIPRRCLQGRPGAGDAGVRLHHPGDRRTVRRAQQRGGRLGEPGKADAEKGSYSVCRIKPPFRPGRFLPQHMVFSSGRPGRCSRTGRKAPHIIADILPAHSTADAGDAIVGGKKPYAALPSCTPSKTVPRTGSWEAAHHGADARRRPPRRSFQRQLLRVIGDKPHQRPRPCLDQQVPVLCAVGQLLPSCLQKGAPQRKRRELDIQFIPSAATFNTSCSERMTGLSRSSAWRNTANRKPDPAAGATNCR